MTANIWAAPDQTARQPPLGRWSIGAVAVSRLRLSHNGPAFAVRGPPHNCCVLLQLVGQSTVEHETLACRLNPGQWTALDAAQLYVQPNALDTQLLVLHIPRQCLVQEIVHEGNLVLELRAYDSRALLRTLRVFSASPHQLDAAITERIAALLCRVVEHAIRQQHSAERRAQRAAFSVYARRLHRAYRYIQRHVDDPELALVDIAKHAACSPRYLRKMFAPGGESVGEFVLHRRLELVHCDLLSLRLSSRPITHIALAHGFNNASHFTRKYRKHFGITPSVMRLAHQKIRLQPPGRRP